MPHARASRLWLGPSGWSYDDWAGIVYPVVKPRGWKALRFVARYFNAVEVNSSFYRIPSARMTAAWPDQTPAEFRFAFKAPQIFTHVRTTPPPHADAAAFKDALAPVAESGKLGPILLQFPWSFRATRPNFDWLARLADAFFEFERFVEVRHSTWAAPEALDAIRRAGGYCNIDQPALHDCLGPTQYVFGRSAYIRLHGRNAAAWFAEGRPSFERYNYLYPESELREWAERIRAASALAEDVYVFANNHYRGQGPVNALELKAMLSNERVAAPAELVRAYPRLAAIARGKPPTTLFET